MLVLTSYTVPTTSNILWPVYTYIGTRAWLEKPGGGGGRDLLLRAPLIALPGWDPGDPIYNENGPFLLLLYCFSAIAILV